ncbi:diacylglycerol/lipid kinase family protein [Streptomyces sp. NPDC053079]|uniref:diacylglycerol/lipid kinase family protein n=1 Tax=Streptomyces sp. NPDC053079 TaxID=3365697 RepID=UPI0037CEFA08
MDEGRLGAHGPVAQRRAARLAVAAATAGVLLLLLVAGGRSIGLVGIGGSAATAAGLWWALTRRGLARVCAAGLAVAAPAMVFAFYVAAGLLWLVVVILVLWGVSVSAGWAALAADNTAPATARGCPVPPPKRPFLIMNPRSGGGKVERFGLREKAEALGADVVLLDPGRPQDVVALARDAVADGADLLGVAGGDGTQALVAGVAAAYGVPFVVITAGTRNHFALDLGLDRDEPSRCLDALTDGVEFRVDLGRVGERVFVNNASFGAYAVVVQSPAYRDDKVRTTLQLLPDVLTRHHGPRLTVAAAGVTLDAPQAVLVSNNPYRVGDLAGLGRRERLDGGVLGLLGVRVDSAAQAAAMLRGRRAPGLTVLTAREILVDADEPVVQVGVDGEPLTFPTPVRCRIEPRALRVRVPRDRPGVPRMRPRLNWRRLWALALARGPVR